MKNIIGLHLTFNEPVELVESADKRKYKKLIGKKFKIDTILAVREGGFIWGDFIVLEDFYHYRKGNGVRLLWVKVKHEWQDKD